MAYSALDDRDHQPRDAELTEILGDARELWDGLIARIEEDLGPVSLDWTFSGKEWGWALRLKRGKRAVLYLTPRADYFMAGFALGQKAVDAAHESDISRSVLDLIDGSQKYAEGRAVRLEIRTDEDIRNAARIAAVKMDN